MLSVPLFRQYLLKTLCVGFFIAGLCFPVIISIKNIFLYISLGLSCLLVPWPNVLKDCKEEPFIASGLALFLLIALSTIHSHAGASRALSILAKYRCLLYPLLIIPLFKKYPWLCTAFIRGLFWSIILLLVISFVNILAKGYYKELPAYYPCFVYINPIYGSFVTALVGYLALVYAFFKDGLNLKQRIFYSTVFLGASSIILFLQHQRTGYFAYFFATFVLIVSLYPKLSFRHRLSLLLLCVPLVLVLANNKTVSKRIELCVSNVCEYYYVSEASTSIGERLGLWETALPYIHQKPILGWGTGSFASIWVDEGLWYLYHTASFRSPSGVPNPHNQFLMLLVEQGCLGLVLFLGWILSFVLSMVRKGWLSIGITCAGAFLIGCWGDSMLFLNVTGNFFVMLCACLLSLPKYQFWDNI